VLNDKALDIGEINALNARQQCVAPGHQLCFEPIQYGKFFSHNVSLNSFYI
jgi:hypothetical protein